MHCLQHKVIVPRLCAGLPLYMQKRRNLTARELRFMGLCLFPETLNAVIMLMPQSGCDINAYHTSTGTRPSL